MTDVTDFCNIFKKKRVLVHRFGGFFYNYHTTIHPFPIGLKPFTLSPQRTLLTVHDTDACSCLSPPFQHGVFLVHYLLTNSILIHITLFKQLIEDFPKNLIGMFLHDPYIIKYRTIVFHAMSDAIFYFFYFNAYIITMLCKCFPSGII